MMSYDPGGESVATWFDPGPHSLWLILRIFAHVQHITCTRLNVSVAFMEET